CLVVSENGNLRGIVTETDILGKAVAQGDDLGGMRVEHIMSSPVRSVPSSMSAMEAGEIMENEKIRRVVVVDDGRPVGTIEQTNIIRVLVSYILSKEVSEIATREVAAMPGSANVNEAAELMAGRNISCVIVMEKNAVAGIFTKRDFLQRVVAQRRDPVRTRIIDVMSFPVVSVPSYYSISSAAKLLKEKGVRRLVVVDHNVLRGVITQMDILKAIKSRLQQDEKNYLRLLGQLTAYSHSIWLSEKLMSILCS
ncbi:MAG: CBS domain-containing protein, partial [Phycisphaerales bacterium]